MSLLEQITQDLKTAQKQSQPERVATLRLLVNSLKNERIKLGHELTADEETKVLQREAKQRRDSITAYESAKRDDLAEAERVELEVISGYLPEPMTEEEIAKEIDKVIAETGASSMAQMGAVVGRVMAAVGARSDGATVSRMVREKLS